MVAADPQTLASENRSASLEALLCDLFQNYRAFHRFARQLGVDDRLVHELPNLESSESLAQLMFTSVAVLRGAGYIDAAFFARLEAQFPRRRKTIRAEALRWGLPASLSMSARVSQVIRTPRSAVWIYSAVAVMLAAVTTAVLLWSPLLDGPDATDMLVADPPQDPTAPPLPQSDSDTTTTPTSGGSTSTAGVDKQPAPPRVVKLVKQSSFERAVADLDLTDCAQLRLKGAAPDELQLDVRAKFGPGAEPTITVLGTKPSKVSTCVESAVLGLVKKRYRGARSDDPLTAKASVGTP